MNPQKAPDEARPAPPLLHRLGVWSATHAWRVVAVWLVVLVGAGLLVPRFTDSLTGSSLSITGSESARAEKLMKERFDSAITEDVVVVFDSATRSVKDPAFREAVERGISELRDQDGVASVEDPYAPDGEAQFSDDGRTALVLAGLTGDERDRQEVAPKLQEALDGTARGDIEVMLTGSSALNAAVVEQEDKDLARAESIGLPIALIVLLIAFGTLVAAGLPLILGVFALMTSFGALGALSYLTTFDTFVQAVVTMLGLALGIDYCLFMVTRQREELGSRRGRSIPEVVGATMATAGKAVLFSGFTVLVSVAGLLLVRAPVFRSMALGVMVAVAVMLAVAMTLLPAVLALLGTRINRFAVPGLRRAVQHPDPEHSVWARWTRLVLRRPVLVGGAATLVLLLAAAPVFGLKLGFDVGASAVADAPAGAGYNLVAKKFAPGTATPVQVVVTSPDGRLDNAGLKSIDRLSTLVKDNKQVDGVLSLTDALKEQTGATDQEALRTALADDKGELDRIVSSSGDATILTVFSKSAPDSDATIDLVHWIRDTAAPRAAGPESGIVVDTGGLTAQTIDVGAEINRGTPWVLTAILGMSFLLLLLAFRSLVLALSAIVMNLLSVGAAFGLLTWVFQDGAGEALLDFTSRGFIQAYLPILTFVVLFGLSMDYEVFLISRMKEEWDRTKDNTRAVTVGVVHTAKVITAAAAIMVVVFASFMITSVVEVKQMGFALAVAVLVDATLIRVVVVPAVMRLLGTANWWLPAWLDRALPRVQLTEGPSPAADDGTEDSDAGRDDPATARSTTSASSSD
ncbi:MMPL family transporter [Streptomyces sp. BA2]|uniref:MMPL family transporter n=1 Tax=Streptomyces sp. BA2 TaxID=436595 RepID=UPI0013276347|nr:MMPL family transporter [Streptomyces sp. BA2]